MTPTEQLQSILSEKYLSEDEDEYKVELMPGLTDQQIDHFALQLPTGQIPAEIRKLLRFARGFDFFVLEEIRFDAYGEFGFENLFPNSIQLAGDGLGNFWILSIDVKGNWGAVFYVSHDPPVVVKHSDDLAQFIQHVHEFGKDEQHSHLTLIHDQIVNELWKKEDGFIELQTAAESDDMVLKNFAASLPENFVIADLRNKPLQNGFSWGKPGTRADKIIRHETELLWGIEQPLRKGFFARLFGKS